MTALPDNPADWPADPYELLGLALHCDRRDARRAYLSLVRQYKPEHAPEQFQRIREAYDAVLRELEWRRPRPPASDLSGPASGHPMNLDPPPGQEHTDLPADNSTAGAGGSDDTPDRDAGQPPPLKPLASIEPPQGGRFSALPEARMDAAWRMAVAGDTPQAYQHLRELFEFERCRVDAALRLYWLLRTCPELDRRKPSEWLAEGLVFRNDGRLVELYQRELRRRPAEALSAHCTRVLSVDHSASFAPTILPIRWRACLMHGKWKLTMKDLSDLAPRLVFQRDAWVRLLLAAMDCLAWDPALDARAAFHQCREQCDSLVGLEQASLVERMDLLVEIVGSWRALQLSSRVPRAWTELIRESWVQPDEARRRLLPVVVQMARDAERSPAQALKQFDQLRTLNAAAAAHLEELIANERAATARFARDGQDALASCGRFYEGLRSIAARLPAAARYAHLRCRLLEFCRTELIEPSTVAGWIDQFARWRDAAAECWSELVDRDGSLQALYHCCRIARG